MINIGRSWFEVGTFSCFDANTSDVGLAIREMSYVIRLKCGMEPYRMYVSQSMSDKLRARNLLDGWEVEISELPNEDSILLAAGADFRAMGRITFFNMV